VEKINKLKKITEKNILNLKKETLIKIINLNNFIEEKFLIDIILEKISKIDDVQKKKFCEIRVLSIIEDLENIKYIDKKKFEKYLIYIYNQKIVIYITQKTANLHDFMEILSPHLKDYDVIKLYAQNDNLLNYLNILELDKNIEKIKIKKVEKIIIEKNKNPIL
jgi:hypothetical protein